MKKIWIYVIAALIAGPVGLLVVWLFLDAKHMVIL